MGLGKTVEVISLILLNTYPVDTENEIKPPTSKRTKIDLELSTGKRQLTPRFVCFCGSGLVEILGPRSHSRQNKAQSQALTVPTYF